MRQGQTHSQRMCSIGSNWIFLNHPKPRFRECHIQYLWDTWAFKFFIFVFHGWLFASSSKMNLLPSSSLHYSSLSVRQSCYPFKVAIQQVLLLHSLLTHLPLFSVRHVLKTVKSMLLSTFAGFVSVCFCFCMAVQIY